MTTIEHMKMSNVQYNYKFDKNEYDFTKELDGAIIDVSVLTMLVVCEKCTQEIEQEAIIKNGRPFHYTCSGIEL
jgi:hypothetical protein